MGNVLGRWYLFDQMGKGNHWISFSELLSLFLDRMVDLNQILSMVGSAFSSRRGGGGRICWHALPFDGFWKRYSRLIRWNWVWHFLLIQKWSGSTSKNCFWSGVHDCQVMLLFILFSCLGYILSVAEDWQI